MEKVAERNKNFMTTDIEGYMEGRRRFSVTLRREKRATQLKLYRYKTSNKEISYSDFSFENLKKISLIANEITVFLKILECNFHLSLIEKIHNTKSDEKKLLALKIFEKMFENKMPLKYGALLSIAHMVKDQLIISELYTTQCFSILNQISNRNIQIIWDLNLLPSILQHLNLPQVIHLIKNFSFDDTLNDILIKENILSKLLQHFSSSLNTTCLILLTLSNFASGSPSTISKLISSPIFNQALNMIDNSNIYIRKECSYILYNLSCIGDYDQLTIVNSLVDGVKISNALTFPCYQVHYNYLIFWIKMKEKNLKPQIDLEICETLALSKNPDVSKTAQLLLA
ncbi:hypothetical protein SteCoe_29436 [Stentor coeruleus]|uniref:IBB domain-containing protein n=1 Tax=Stentor coeruleus TaxID=5963 RepID=A0A1R2B5W7_9CILI|nr:hypothetical protein SteCoe_29436 [Stentor coeruleus]